MELTRSAGTHIHTRSFDESRLELSLSIFHIDSQNVPLGNRRLVKSIAEKLEQIRRWSLGVRMWMVLQNISRIPLSRKRERYREWVFLEYFFLYFCQL